MKRMQRQYSGNKYSMVRTSINLANRVQQAMIKLATHTSSPITVSDTALGRHRQVNNIFDIVTKMREEREDLRKQLEEMDELEEEENSLSISAMPNMACKKLPPKYDE